ncbi:hypothetical protein [Pseudohoeflea coraliihabitans]|uniref:Uncharacterized protein n=1 Tax=Pseudohoeflea coraliihabitans TaxID=2860393 RepID=A0ABS6WML7_9HYPH|nr:hypothetical protein [Pseudohoeflea sp. DP4N28-3]MBW3096314.1 hypothetical protein [Pseudohoeflea sp. DP4N28-3]
MALGGATADVPAAIRPRQLHLGAVARCAGVWRNRWAIDGVAVCRAGRRFNLQKGCEFVQHRAGKLSLQFVPGLLKQWIGMLMQGSASRAQREAEAIYVAEQFAGGGRLRDDAQVSVNDDRHSRALRESAVVGLRTGREGASQFTGNLEVVGPIRGLVLAAVALVAAVVDERFNIAHEFCEFTFAVEV